MLGQPVYFLTPDVVGVHLTGALREGVTATDLALTVTQLLRKAKVVGKFVEFYGPGAPRSRSSTARRSATWRPSTAPPWASSRSTPSARLPPGDGPQPRARGPLRGLLQGPGPLGHAGEGPDRLFAGHRARPGLGRPERRRPEAPPGPDRAAEAEAGVRRLVLEAGRRERVRQEVRGLQVGQAPTCRSTATARPRSATAASSSRPSRAAPTPRTPRSCWPPGSWRRRRWSAASRSTPRSSRRSPRARGS
jgi:hypothetical protein